VSAPEPSEAEPWLRPVAPADLADLAEIHAQAFDHPWSAEALRATLDGAHVFGLVGGAGAHAAGFILISSVAGEAEILTLAVRPTDRRRGIAAALVEAASSVALARAGEVMWLEVAEDNPAAIALYGRTGFTLAGRRPRYYPRPNGGFADALLMRRPLNSGPA
jgi:[ribosomal protein S18]-alanine N-acetyltransferase